MSVYKSSCNPYTFNHNLCHVKYLQNTWPISVKFQKEVEKANDIEIISQCLFRMKPPQYKIKTTNHSTDIHCSALPSNVLCGRNCDRCGKFNKAPVVFVRLQTWWMSLCCKPWVDKTAYAPKEDICLFSSCTETVWIFKRMEPWSLATGEWNVWTYNMHPKCEREKWCNLRKIELSLSAVWGMACQHWSLLCAGKTSP